jgi:hypothetical protein
MKTLSFFFIILLIVLSLNNLYSQDYQYKVVETTKKNLSDIKVAAYGKDISSQPTKQPLESSSDARNILNKLQINPEYLKYATDNDKAMIVITHPIDLNKAFNSLNKKSEEEKEKINKKYLENITAIKNMESFSSSLKTLKDNIKNSINTSTIEIKPSNLGELAISYSAIQSQIDLIQNRIDKLKKDDQKINTDEYKLLTESLLKLQKLQPSILELINKEKMTLPLSIKQQGELATIYSTIQLTEVQTNSQISTLKEENGKLKIAFEDLCDHYIESKTISNFILHKSETRGTNFYNEQYLFDVKDIIIVCIGGKQDLTQLNVEVVKKTSAFISSINAAIEVVNILTGGNIKGGLAIDSGGGLSCPDEDQIPISYIQLVNEQKIDPPYDLKIKIPEQKNDLVYTIHEKNTALLTFGISTKWITPTVFKSTLNTNTFKVQEGDFVDGFKGEFYLLFDYCPWGRDLDKLAENKVTNRIERLSLTGGLKVSKDPLQSLVFGLAYAVSPSLRIIGGFSYNRVPRIDATINITNLSDNLEYLKENVDREYKPGFFLGFSLSPTDVLKLVK